MSGVPLTVLAAVMGVSLGSFLNVCVARWPAGQSVMRPRSGCWSCRAPLRWFENIPVLGYLFARGRCSRCGVRVSVQYPLVEIATGMIWAGMAATWGVHPEALRGGLFLTILLGIAIVVSLGLGRWMTGMLGGMTGDTYGAVNEVGEVVVLVLGIALFSAIPGVFGAPLW